MFKGSSIIEKVVVSCNLGKLDGEREREVLDMLGRVTGQKPILTRAKKSINNFKIRAGMKNGAMVTLRKQRAENFLKKLILFIFPGDSSFKGIKGSCLRGDTLNFGIVNLHLFPEIEELRWCRGLNVVVKSFEGKMSRIIEEFLIPFR